MKPSLSFSIIQSNLTWEQIDANLALFEQKINAIEIPSEIIVLPEMFQTGFSMNPKKLAESMEGKTMNWMANMSLKKRAIITGSLIIKENGNYYNRLIWMQPDGKYAYYDKRHLFSYAGEDMHFTTGNKRLIAKVNGWRICTTICYDLRFPVWSRQANEDEYDILLVVANWPQKRSLAWNTLLRARAIENQSYVVACNRTGYDENGIVYHGESQIINPLGELLQINEQEEIIISQTLLKQEIESVRIQFPFLKDKDNFVVI